MPKEVADHLHRHALIEKVLGGGMPQGVRSPAPGDDAEGAQAPSEHPAQRPPGERSERRQEGDEQRAVGFLGTDILEIPKDGLAHAPRQWVDVSSPRLRTPHT